MRHETTHLQPSDEDLLKWCHTLRFVTIDHLIALSGRSQQSLNRRMLALLSNKYLTRVIFPNPNQSHIYTLGKAAIPFLVGQGLAKTEKLDTRIRTSELKPMFLQHSLMIVDIHTTLLLASRTHHIKLAAWQEGKPIFDSVTFYEDGTKQRLPVCPDGFFTTINTERPEGKNRLHFALEADRSTTAQKRFEDKIRAYCNYLDQKKQEQKFGVKWFRVVTVCLTEARARNLAEMTRNAAPKRLQPFFLYTSINKFSFNKPTDFYDPIFINPIDAEPVRLVPQ